MMFRKNIKPPNTNLIHVLCRFSPYGKFIKSTTIIEIQEIYILTPKNLSP
jgi:hypothetical protein